MNDIIIEIKRKLLDVHDDIPDAPWSHGYIAAFVNQELITDNEADDILNWLKTAE